MTRKKEPNVMPCDCALTPTARDKVTDCNLFQVSAEIQGATQGHDTWRMEAIIRQQ